MPRFEAACGPGRWVALDRSKLTMAREIRPTRPDEIPEVSQFLVSHFGTGPEAQFAAPDVLHWKYFDPRGDRDAPRSLVAFEDGVLVGHGAMCHGWFHYTGDPSFKVSVMHGIDWVSSPMHPSTGAFLMIRGHHYSETQYALNYNESAKRVIERAGYELLAQVPVYLKVLNPVHRLRGSSGPRSRAMALARTARDLARKAVHPGRKPRLAVTLRPVEQFGAEVCEVLDRCNLNVVYTSRQPAWLNHALRYPRSKLTGWLIEHESALRGFALLNVVRQGETRLGKIVECFLDSGPPELWHAAIWELTAALRAQGADIAECFASTPWMTEALRSSGFYRAHELNFLLRDRKKRLPQGAVFHLTPFEADYAYS
jgi:hypothetical protein